MTNPRFFANFLILIVAVTLITLLTNSGSAQVSRKFADSVRLPGFDIERTLDLPDPLVFNNGKRLTNKRSWPRRRKEIIELFETHIYGVAPKRNTNKLTPKFGTTKEADIFVTPVPIDADLDTIPAKLKEVEIKFPADGPVAHLLLILPADAEKPCPVFLGYNYRGNHRIHPTKQITINPIWLDGRVVGMPNEDTRGKNTDRWRIHKVLERGYGVATVYYGSVCPDFGERKRMGVRSLDRELSSKPDGWGAISAWAWGLQYAMDYLQQEPGVDHDKIVATGFGRVGAVALWAAATDERFAMAICNGGGLAGAGLASCPTAINDIALRNQKHWFCDNHKKYEETPSNAPVDQHMLLSLMAPRPVYISSSNSSLFADPQSELFGAFYAGAVYRMFGEAGLGIDDPVLPRTGTSIGDKIGYHSKLGSHRINGYDWNHYLNFVDRHFGEQ